MRSDLSFLPYQSTLLNYPLLSASISPAPSFSDSDRRDTCRDRPSPDTGSPCFPLVVPDLASLKIATVMNGLDASGQLCQYEIPGGGVCHDEGCTNVHLRRVLEEAEGDGFDMSGASS